MALLLFYKEDTHSISSTSSSDKEDDKNESKEEKFLNHKARPIYSIDAREASLTQATHFPSDSMDSNRLVIKFEPTQSSSLFLKDKNAQQPKQQQRKKSNRKNRLNDDTYSVTNVVQSSEETKSNQNNVKNLKRTNKGMVYLEISDLKKRDAGIYRCRVDYKKGRTINWLITLSISGMFFSFLLFIFLCKFIMRKV